eukprot:6718837-Pyramimonas_sp.AAC.1
MASPSPWGASMMTAGPERPHRGRPPSRPAGRFQAHAMYRALVDRVAAWAKQWDMTDFEICCIVLWELPRVKPFAGKLPLRSVFVDGATAPSPGRLS